MMKNESNINNLSMIILPENSQIMTNVCYHEYKINISDGFVRYVL